jgi:glutamine amidotransferase
MGCLGVMRPAPGAGMLARIAPLRQDIGRWQHPRALSDWRPRPIMPASPLAAGSTLAPRLESRMIALIDYGMGNLGSVAKALARVGCEPRITDDPAVVKAADGVVLPGVGAFDDCISNLTARGLDAAVKDVVAAGTPFLGICLGLQMLFESSEEGGKYPGLGIFKGKVVRFTHNLKIPQIGWNQIQIRKPAPQLEGVAEGSWVYFVHSYYVVPEDSSIIACTTDYGYEFVSAVWRDNVFASQFHPEKSQAIGLQILENFAGLVTKGA